MKRIRGLAAVSGMMLAAVVYVFAGPAAAASAQTAPNVLTYPLAADTEVSSAETALITVDLYLTAGQTRRIVGQLDSIMSSNSFPSIDDSVAVECLDANGALVGVSAWAETSLIPGVPATLRPSLLFAAPHDGLYHCHLLATVAAGGPATMTARKGFTYLMLSDGNEVGARWWQHAPCNPTGDWSTCAYLGDPHSATDAYVLSGDGGPSYQWTAAAGATLARATANVEVTTCGHTASCGGRRSDSDHTTVISHLEAVQLDAFGVPCNVTRSTDRTDVVGIIPHHYNIPYDLPQVLVLANCGSRNFLVRIYLRWVEGNPLKIDGTIPDPSGHDTVMTNAFIVNGFYAPTTTVPSVTGMDQATAQNNLEAANLHVGTVTSVVRFVPPGTVVGQNAVAGTVEPVNSRVDLTVAIHGVAVPDVIGMTGNAARTTVQSAGLVASVVSVVRCDLETGLVFDTTPDANGFVAPGSTVTIRVAAFSRVCT
ncbi:MAG: hypothetical protein V7603_5258 [Micromonosporaceae bacterium]